MILHSCTVVEVKPLVSDVLDALYSSIISYLSPARDVALLRSLYGAPFSTWLFFPLIVTLVLSFVYLINNFAFSPQAVYCVVNIMEKKMHLERPTNLAT